MMLMLMLIPMMLIPIIIWSIVICPSAIQLFFGTMAAWMKPPGDVGLATFTSCGSAQGWGNPRLRWWLWCFEHGFAGKSRGKPPNPLIHMSYIIQIFPNMVHRHVLRAITTNQETVERCWNVCGLQVDLGLAGKHLTFLLKFTLHSTTARNPKDFCETLIICVLSTSKSSNHPKDSKDLHRFRQALGSPALEGAGACSVSGTERC